MYLPLYTSLFPLFSLYLVGRPESRWATTSSSCCVWSCYEGVQTVLNGGASVTCFRFSSLLQGKFSGCLVLGEIRDRGCSLFCFSSPLSRAPVWPKLNWVETNNGELTFFSRLCQPGAFSFLGSAFGKGVGHSDGEAQNRVPSSGVVASLGNACPPWDLLQT